MSRDGLPGGDDPLGLGRRIAAAPSRGSAARLISRYQADRQLREPVRGVAEVLAPAERVEILAQVEREAQATVADLNRSDQPKEPQPMPSITGASYLAASIRDRIANAKARMAESTQKLGSAIDQLEQSATYADGAIATVQKEAAELSAAVAQLTNGPPET